MSTKVKGDKIKEGSIPFEALDESLDYVPALKGFIKQLDENDLGKDIEIPYASSIVVYYGDNIITMNDGYSRDFQSYGPSSKVTLSVRAESSSLILSVSNIETPSMINGYRFKIYEGINKIKKEFLPDDIGGADWNAQEGETGYIENRTHYVDLTYFKHLTINKNDFDLSFDGSYWIAEYNTLLNEDQLFVYCSAAGKEFYSPIGNSEIQLPNYMYVKTIDVFADYGDFVGRKLVVRNGAIDEEFRGESFYIADIWSYPHIKELSSIYLPNTVVKTTPQTLSDTDKNQALANLGIDPVVWKYMMNPIRLVENVTVVPEELIGEKINHSELGEVYLFKHLIPQIYNIINIDLHRPVSIVGPTNNDYETLGFWVYDAMVGCYINAEHKMVCAEIPWQ